MSVECCGKPRASRFCPDCGRKLADDSSVAGLLAHCRKMAEQHRKEAERWRAALRAHEQIGSATTGKGRQRQGRAERNAARWQSWADALAALLDEAEVKAEG